MLSCIWEKSFRQRDWKKKSFDKSTEKAKKLDRQIIEKIQKAFNKLTWKIKAAKTQRKKSDGSEKKWKNKKKRENKGKNFADKAAKKVYQVFKVTNQRKNRKALSSIINNLQKNLLVIEEENNQLENTQTF